MKTRIISIITAFATALALSTGAFAATKTASLESFSQLTFSDVDSDNDLMFHHKVEKSMRLNKSILKLSDTDVMYIPKGKALYIAKGADLDGSIYIRKGGYLILEDGDTRLDGNIVCDGYLTIKNNATLTLGSKSMLFIGGTGRLNVAKDKNVIVSTGADIACIGTENLTDTRIGTKVVSAISNGKIGNKVLTKSEIQKYLPTYKAYTDAPDEAYEKVRSVISFMFDDGSLIKVYSYRYASDDSDKIYRIGDFVISTISYDLKGTYTDPVGWTQTNFIGDVAYKWGFNSGVYILDSKYNALEKTDKNDPVGVAVSNIKEYKFIGYFNGKEDIEGQKGARMYLMDNENILMIWKITPDHIDYPKNGEELLKNNSGGAYYYATIFNAIK